LGNLKRQLERYRRRQGDNIKMELKGTGCEGVDWVHLNRDKGQWRALVTMVINFGIHNRIGISSPAERILGFKEGLCSLASDI
jgi:hypothetical protein